MKTITLHIGDKLRVLVDHPLSACLFKGDIVTVVAFDKGSCTPVVSNSAAGRRMLPGIEVWYTSSTQWPKHYKKVSKGAK